MKKTGLFETGFEWLEKRSTLFSTYEKFFLFGFGLLDLKDSKKGKQITCIDFRNHSLASSKQKSLFQKP